MPKSQRQKAAALLAANAPALRLPKRPPRLPRLPKQPRRLRPLPPSSRSVYCKPKAFGSCEPDRLATPKRFFVVPNPPLPHDPRRKPIQLGYILKTHGLRGHIVAHFDVDDVARPTPSSKPCTSPLAGRAHPAGGAHRGEGAAPARRPRPAQAARHRAH